MSPTSNRSHRISHRAAFALLASLALAGCSADDTTPTDAQRSDRVAVDATGDAPAADHATLPDVPPPPFDSAMDCPGHATCEDCRELGCGWCLDTNRCVPGTMTGSADGTCMGASWAYTLDQCRASDGGGGSPADAASSGG